MIYLAIPVHSIEGVLNKLDPRVVHLSVRSPVRPHDAAIPIASQKNKWSITLFFDSMFANKRADAKGGGNNGKTPEVGHKDALTALDYITMNRMRVRRKMMAQISELVLGDKSEATQSTTATDSTGATESVDKGNSEQTDSAHSQGKEPGVEEPENVETQSVEVAANTE